MKGVAVVLGLLLVACSEGPVAAPVKRAAIRRPAAPVRTDRSRYVLANGPHGPETMIVATLRAPADRALYIVNCNGATGVTLQRKVGEEWVWGWVITMNACLSPPIVVPAGGEYTASIHVLEQVAGRKIEAGTYRVVWTGVLSAFDPNVRGFGPELPLEERVSAPIAIEAPRAERAADRES